MADNWISDSRVDVKLEGVDELKRALASVSKQIRTKAIRSALWEGGKVIRKAAQANAPMLRTKRPDRARGTIKKNIIVRFSKFAKRRKDEGVYISVRPLKGVRQKRLGKAGASNPNDPFYWWFVEFGTKPRVHRANRRKVMKFGNLFRKKIKHPGTDGEFFMTRAAKSHGQAAINAFMRSVVPKIEQFNNKGAARVR